MKLQRRRAAFALLAASTLALTACSDAEQGPSTNAGGEEGASSLSGELAGAGSSAQSAAMEAWIAGFQSANPEVTVTYDAVGSGAGRDQFVEGGVDFAGSDAALDDEELALATERCGEGGAVAVPLYVSPIAVAYNLPGVEELNLKAATIAGIFDQKITNWNDPAIAADNPDAELPDLAITPVNRQDDSGTTENFTEYLAAAAPEAWPYEPDGVFPVQGGESADGTSGVVGATEAAEGAITYADASQVNDLGIAKVGVGEEFVELTPEAAAAVVAASERVEGRPEGDLALELARDTTEGGQYPVVLVSYQIACSSYDDPAKAELVKAFFSYIASEEGQQAAAEAAGSAPVSEELRAEVEPAIELIGSGS